MLVVVVCFSGLNSWISYRFSGFRSALGGRPRGRRLSQDLAFADSQISTRLSTVLDDSMTEKDEELVASKFENPSRPEPTHQDIAIIPRTNAVVRAGEDRRHSVPLLPVNDGTLHTVLTSNRGSFWDRPGDVWKAG